MKSVAKLIHIVALVLCIGVLWFAAGIEPITTLRELYQTGEEFYGSGASGGNQGDDESGN